jgi:hypothetical protein
MHCRDNTCEIEEVRVLVELVEDGSRAVFDVRSCKDRNRVWGKRFRKLHAAVVVLLGGDAGCHWHFVNML